LVEEFEKEYGKETKEVQQQKEEDKKVFSKELLGSLQQKYCGDGLIRSMRDKRKKDRRKTGDDGKIS